MKRCCRLFHLPHFRSVLLSLQPHQKTDTVYQVVKDHDDTNIAHEVSQILLQGILAYDQNPAVDSHTAFVLRMDRTILQLSMATTPRIYMEELCQGKPLSENLELFHSELYDLRECDRRKEALRLIIGLLRLLETKKRD
jgi:hypothetical protein